MTCHGTFGHPLSTNRGTSTGSPLSFSVKPGASTWKDTAFGFCGSMFLPTVQQPFCSAGQLLRRLDTHELVDEGVCAGLWTVHGRLRSVGDEVQLLGGYEATSYCHLHRHRIEEGRIIRGGEMARDCCRQLGETEGCTPVWRSGKVLKKR